VKAVEDVQRLRAFLADHVQVGLPHVRADELNLRGELGADHGKESREGFDGAFSADPQQASEALVDLVDQSQVFVALGILDFIDADDPDRLCCRSSENGVF